MNPDNIKKCNKCLIYKSIDQYHKKQYECKTCRLAKDKNKYKETKITNKQDKIKERIPFRNEFFRFYLEKGNDFKDFASLFIPFEKYDEMKNQPELFSFCERSDIKKRDREIYSLEYDKKFWLNIVFCHNIKTNVASRIRII